MISTRDPWFIGAVLVVVVGACLMFAQLGSHPLWDYDEAIYANVIHDTLASGNVFALSLAGAPWFEKPPLYFWTSMAFDALLHHPELSYRLTSAIAGVASLVLVMLVAYAASESIAVAAMAGAMLLTTGAFFEASRQLRLDIPTVAMILLACYCFLRGRTAPRWYLGIGVALALGILFKSVIALLAGAFFLAWSLAYRDCSWLRSVWLWLGGLVGLAILLPWHWYETQQSGGAFWKIYFAHNVFDRVGGQIGATTGLGEFLGFFFAFAAPWSIAFVLLVLYGVARLRLARAEAARPLVAFSLAAVLIIALFCASRVRIFYYLLPAYPFMAIALALAFEQCRERYGAKALAALFVLLFTGGGVAVAYGYHLTGAMRTNDLIVADEQQAGLILSDEPEPAVMYAYEYDYWDTIKYYSGRRDISVMSDDTVLDRPFILLTSTPYMQWHSFDPELQKHLSVIYQGPVVTLYRFQP